MKQNEQCSQQGFLSRLPFCHDRLTARKTNLIGQLWNTLSNKLSCFIDIFHKTAGRVHRRCEPSFE